jgi:hypothetical protein
MAVLEDFENAGLAANLALTDPNSKITIPSATQVKVGSGSMQLELTGLSATTNLGWTVNADHISLGFWYRTGSGYGNYGGTYCKFFSVLDNNSTGDMGFLDWNTNDFNVRAIKGAMGTLNVWNVTDATWYWFTFEFVRNGTCRARLYDASMAQVGTDWSYTEPGNNQAQVVKLGQDDVSAPSTQVYFDQLWMDATGSTWPVLDTATAAPLQTQGPGTPFLMSPPYGSGRRF